MDEQRLVEWLSEALAAERREPSDERVSQLRMAVAGDAADRQHSARERRSAPRLPLFGGLAASFATGVLVAAVALGALERPAGELEFSAAVMPEAGSTLDLSVRRTGIGRVIRLDSDFLPVLPTGQYYEVWFIGPGDAPDSLNRISAGTFHPDPDGGVEVQFAAAVDPTLYPVLSITVEPGDGDPTPSGTEILRTDLAAR